MVSKSRRVPYGPPAFISVAEFSISTLYSLHCLVDVSAPFWSLLAIRPIICPECRRPRSQEDKLCSALEKEYRLRHLRLSPEFLYQIFLSRSRVTQRVITGRSKMQAPTNSRAKPGYRWQHLTSTVSTVILQHRINVLPPQILPR